MVKQSAKDRAGRLSNGCCPIHGIPMLQIGLTNVVAGKQLFIAECPRNDCSIQGTTSTPFGSVSLLPAFQVLLGPVAVSSVDRSLP